MKHVSDHLLAIFQSASLPSTFNPMPPYFFHIKSFQWKGPVTVKIREKVIDQTSGYSSFCFEIPAHLGHLFALTSQIIRFDG